jgi:hydrogenase-4 component B
LIGALAVACFVKAYGVVFLGTPRSEHARHPHESPPTMIFPMGVLIACCFLIGLFPRLIAPIFGQAVSAWAPDFNDAGSRLTTLAPLDWITTMGLVLIASLVAVRALLWWLVGRSPAAASPTWGCGYAAPEASMQYTSSSFAQMLVKLFGWALRPRMHKPPEMGLFPQQADFHSDVPDTVLDEAVQPFFHHAAGLFARFRIFQAGSIQAYLLYIFLALIALLLWRH